MSVVTIVTKVGLNNVLFCSIFVGPVNEENGVSPCAVLKIWFSWTEKAL